MKFTDIFIRRPVLASVISLLILLLGLRALDQLQVRQFPTMSNSVITITTTYAGANADLMQGFITSPLQRSIAGADGIDYLTAESTAGISTITAHIKLNYDANVAMTDIMAKVAQVSNNLPKESSQPVIIKNTGSQMALLYLGFNSKDMTNQQITDYLIRIVQPKLQAVGGVATADILGGQTYAMRIWLNVDKMTALNLSTAEVAQALQNQNFQTAAGQIKGRLVSFNINAKTNIDDTEAFQNIIIKSDKNTLVRLRDIANIELGAETYDSSVIFNGKNAVFIGIKGTPTANPLTVIDSVKKVLPELADNYPPSLKAKVVYDSTEFIRSSIHEVASSIIEASIIVILVIFLFLGTLRTVIIPVITIPLSLIGVCSFMLAMGYSLNLLTLLAMVLAIGLVVDDAIVVVENIYRHIEEGLTPFDAAILGAREIASPIIAMTTTLAAVYAPIGLMTGLTGALFKEFAFTLALAVILSGILALTLSPMMCSKILNRTLTQHRLAHAIDAFFETIKHKYVNRLKSVLQYRSVTVVFVLIMIAGCGLLAATTTSELAPEEDQSFVFVATSAPQYANIDYLRKYNNTLHTIFTGIPEVQDYFILNGAGTVNNGMAGAILKPWDKRKRKQNQIQQELQTKVAKIAGVNTFAVPLPSIPGASDGLPIQFVISSTADHKVIYQTLEKLQQIAQASGLFMFVDLDLKFDLPELEVSINREKAGLMGVNMQDIGTSLAALLGGNYINRFAREGNSYEVIPQVSQQYRLNPDTLKNINIPAGSSNKLIPLTTILNFNIVTKPNHLNQFQQLNSATLQGMMMPGKTITQGLDFLTAEAQKILPLGMTYDFAGQSRQAIQEGSTMLVTFFFALIIIYLVLAAQFESFRDPFIILISVPMSIAGALIPLNLGLATLNIYTGIGLVTLIGLISKHGILMVNFANQLQIKEGLDAYSAIMQSAAIRLRPILMTTAAMVLGAVPLIIATGAGAASRFNIGLVIASGMFIGTAFTLFVVPTMYTFFSNRTALPNFANSQLNPQKQVSL